MVQAVPYLGPRWTPNPGYIPGEPLAWLDVDPRFGEDPDTTARAAVVELDTNPVTYRAVLPGGETCKPPRGYFPEPFEHAYQAARAAEHTPSTPILIRRFRRDPLYGFPGADWITVTSWTHWGPLEKCKWPELPLFFARLRCTVPGMADTFDFWIEVDDCAQPVIYGRGER